MMNLRIYNQEYARYPANLSDFKISQRFLAACTRFQRVAGPSCLVVGGFLLKETKPSFFTVADKNNIGAMCNINACMWFSLTFK